MRVDKECLICTVSLQQLMLIMGKVVAGYRLSWSCMQLAYVSTGSFISPGGQIPVHSFFQGKKMEPKSPRLDSE